MVVVPTLKKVPEELVEVVEAIPERSVAVGSVHVTVAPELPSSTLWTVFDGQVWIVGGVVSTVG